MQNQDQCTIVIKNLRHVYDNGKVALDGINLEIGVGLYGLLGANGAGKSTLMRIICTLLEPLQGQVCVGGYDVVDQRHQVRQLLGYLPQEFGAWRLHRVEEVLDTLALLSGLTDKQSRKAKVAEVLKSVGLEAVSSKKVKQLSGGMLRRLGVAQALVHDPKVLIMDEPTIGLDPEERLRFRQLMADLSLDRVILLSTHIVADLGAGCSSLILIHEGKIEFTDSPDVLVKKASDKVFEVVLSAENAQMLESAEHFEIVSRFSRNGQSVLRGVAKDGVAPQGGVAADNITLEEAYLAYTA